MPTLIETSSPTRIAQNGVSAGSAANMCAGAAVNARIARVVYGCADPKAGYCGTLGNIPQDPRLNHRCEVEGGLREAESAGLLRLFFRARREKGAPARA